MLFASSLEQGVENEVEFFSRLDDEFNKLVGFYKKEVGELMREAEELSKQMVILIALRVKVEKPDFSFEDSNEHVSLTGITPSSTSTSTVKSTIPRTPGCSRLEVTQEVEIAEETSLEDAKSYHRKPSRGIVQPTIQKLKPVSLELLPQVRINVQPETPISTLKCMVMSSTSQLS